MYQLLLFFYFYFTIQIIRSHLLFYLGVIFINMGWGVRDRETQHQCPVLLGLPCSSTTLSGRGAEGFRHLNPTYNFSGIVGFRNLNPTYNLINCFVLLLPFELLQEVNLILWQLFPHLIPVQEI